MKLSSGTKIAIGFVVIVGGGYGAMRVYTDRAIMHKHFAEIEPGDLNIIGVDPGAGYRVNIQNQVAVLVQSQGGFGGESNSGGGATEGAIKGRLPLSDMLKVLRGDTNALGEFISSINNLKENENWPPIRVVWTADRIAKALKGDPKEKEELERDLNMHLDGTPLSEIRIPSLENGIIIQIPVKVHVNVGGTVKLLTGQVMQPFKPLFVKTVEQKYEEKTNVTPAIIKGYYLAEAQALNTKNSTKEDIRALLQSRIDPKSAEQYAERPEQILKYAKVVVNDSMIERAESREYDTSSGKRWNLILELNDEGRERLWQFSKPRVGYQLLVVSAGVGIAAPRIEHELMLSELTVTQLEDKRLLDDAIKTFTAAKAKQTKTGS